MSDIFSRKGVVFLLLFTLLTLVGMQINFSALVGEENQFFTLFQFFGPIAGGFLGVWGAAAVIGAQLVNFVLVGKEITTVNLLRLLPMIFAALYFSRNRLRGIKDKLGIAVPIFAIVVFWLHPVGQQAWFFALFWTIPIISKFLPDNLLLRSVGATFSAHAVGGALWVWTVPMSAEAWIALIPIVAFERALFTLGIAGSYVVFTNVLNAIDTSMDLDIKSFLNLEKRYLVWA